MNKIRWWVLGGILTAALTAAMLGPSVRGQPQLPSVPTPSMPTPLVPPAVSQAPILPSLPAPAAPVVPSVPAVGVPPSPAASPTSPPVPVSIPVPDRPSAGLEPVGGLSRSDAKPAPLQMLPYAISPASKQEAAALPFPTKDATGTMEVRLGRQEPAVSLEWVGPATTRLNQPMTCQLLVRNTSSSTVQNVVVRHRLSPGVTCRASEPQPAMDDGELVWSLGTMSAGQTRRVDLKLVAQIKGPVTCQATVTFSGTAAHQVQVSEPRLAVKIKTPERALAGEPVTLLYAVSNPGDGVADAVKLKTLLPEGLAHAHGRVIEVDLGALAPKEVRTLQLVCTAHGSGMHKSQALVTADGNLSAADEVQIEVVLPKLDLAMSGPKLRYIDRKAAYVLKVTNPGSAPAANVVVRGAVPPSFKYHAASAGGVYDAASRSATWVLGDLQPGQSRDVTLELVPTAPGDHKVAAQVTSAKGMKAEAEARTVVEGLSALLIEVADTDDPVEVGGETTYEVRVANTGTKTETNVEMVCTLPEQVEFRTAKGGGNMRFCVEGRDVIFEPVAKLTPRADVVYRIQVRGKAPGDVRFRVRVRADGLSEPVIREECTRFYNDDAPAK